MRLAIPEPLSVFVDGQECIGLPLTRGMTAIIDKSDGAAAGYLWFAISGSKCGDLWYATRWLPRYGTPRKGVKLHRWIMGVTDPEIEVDHINGNGLDNRRSNLRLVSHAQNILNSKTWHNSRSGFKGVSISANGKWRARINDAQNRTIQIGTFESKEAAASAYREFSVRVHGVFSVHNRNQTNPVNHINKQ